MSWNNNGNGGPWGQRPGGKNHPNFEEMLKKGQNQFKDIIPPSFQNSKMVMFVVVLALCIWLLTGFYKMNENEKGVVLTFGEYSRTTEKGLRYHLPYPIETVEIVNTDRENRLAVGSITTNNGSGRSFNNFSTQVDNVNMLTGDENIVVAPFTVLWNIKDPADYLFNVRNPELTLRKVSEAALREVVGQTGVQAVLKEDRAAIQSKALRIIQETMDLYKSGIHVKNVLLQKVDIPDAVVDAFRDVQRAKADQERMRNEAEAYRNSIIPVAEGQAAKILELAKAYKRSVIAEAEGKSKRFIEIYKSYAMDKDIFVKRRYLETMESILANRPKIIIDNEQGVVPYLPLSELKKNASSGNDQKGDK